MSTTAYLYRRNGTYYFRWSIPLACRLRMPTGEPCELRLSLRTTHPPTARHRAARCWLAALEAAEGFLVSGRAIRYNDLIAAIRTRARMPTETTAPETPLLSLGAVAGTVEVQALKDTLAHLDGLGATFYLSVAHRAANLWVDRPEPDGSLRAELVERIEDFADATAYLPRSCLTAALAANENLLMVEAVFSRLPGMWEGSEHAKRPYEVRFDTPLVVNLSALLVDAELAKATPKATQPTRTIASPDNMPSPICDPILLSKGLELWLERNQSWSAATKANYTSYVQQFIDVVGKDLSTTDLTADHFTEFDNIVYISDGVKWGRIDGGVTNPSSVACLPRLDGSLTHNRVETNSQFKSIKGDGTNEAMASFFGPCRVVSGNHCFHTSHVICIQTSERVR